MNSHTPEHPYVTAFFPNRKSTLASQLHRRQQTISSESRGSVHLHTCKTSPVVDEMVRRMELIAPVYPSRATRNRWRYYERCRKPLGRFIAIAPQPARTIRDSARKRAPPQYPSRYLMI